MKMINGKLPTWYVIKRVSQDPELYAKAPDTLGNYASKVDNRSGEPAMRFFQDSKWVSFELEVTSRNDWTLYRRGKKKRKTTRRAGIGEMRLGRIVSSDDEITGQSAVENAVSRLIGTYDIIAVPVRR